MKITVNELVSGLEQHSGTLEALVLVRELVAMVGIKMHKGGKSSSDWIGRRDASQMYDALTVLRTLDKMIAERLDMREKIGGDLEPLSAKNLPDLEISIPAPTADLSETGIWSDYFNAERTKARE